MWHQHKTITVTAGSGSASAGVWVRSKSNPQGLLLPTVAHILFSRHFDLRAPVRVNGVKVRVTAMVPLEQGESISADAALLALPSELTRSAFFPAAGHLNRFCQNITVQCVGRSGRRVIGQLVSEGWSGSIAYNFGTRGLTHQWIVRTNADQGYGDRVRRGDSGAVWMTLNGVAVGLQVGVLRHRPRYVILTPFQTICSLFGVAIAG